MELPESAWMYVFYSGLVAFLLFALLRLLASLGPGTLPSREDPAKFRDGGNQSAGNARKNAEDEVDAIFAAHEAKEKSL